MTATRTPWLDEPEQAAWRAYLDMTAKLSARLNRDLAADAGLSLADFAVLATLSEHAEGRMRVLELARLLGWEKSRLSHQLRRMQQRGLIRRDVCPEDGRGAVIALEDAGRRTIEHAAPKHVASVRRYLFDVLSPAEVRALGAIATSVVSRLDADCPATGGCGDDPATGGCGDDPVAGGCGDDPVADADAPCL